MARMKLTRKKKVKKKKVRKKTLRLSTYSLNTNQISEVFGMRNKIDLEPLYQRQGELWDKYKKQLFLDSIFNRYDIPKMYLHVLEKPVIKKKKKFFYAVIDGRQRLELLWKFIDDDKDVVLGDNEIYFHDKPLNLEGYTYSKLASDYPGLRGYFDNYRLPIVCVETENDDDGLIEEMFSRLNEAVSINAAEKRNAKRGKMILQVRKIANHRFFKKRVSFTNIRLQHHEVSARILFLENCIKKGEIIDTKKRFLDDFVVKYKSTLPLSPIYKDVVTVLDKMANNFTNNDSMIKKQGRILIYYLLHREALHQNRLRNVSRTELMRFDKKVAANKKLAETGSKSARFDLIQYDRASIQGTNDAGSIKLRFSIIARYLDINSDRIDSLN